MTEMPHLVLTEGNLQPSQDAAGRSHLCGDNHLPQSLLYLVIKGTLLEITITSQAKSHDEANGC